MSQASRPAQALNGAHHVTGITADVASNLDFWCRILGLRFIKKTLNFETTFRYHSYFSDANGSPGSVVTFLEFNDAPVGRKPGRGNIASAVLRLASAEAIDFWADRLTREQVFSERLRLNPAEPTRLTFFDPEGHQVELMVSDSSDPPQRASASDIPSQFQILGIEGVRSYCAPSDLLPYATHMGFVQEPKRFEQKGASKSLRWYFAQPPDRPFQDISVGVWHHIALDAEDLRGWRDHSAAGPTPTTEIFDHHFFDSCYSPTPGGLVELCTGPGFLADQTNDELGEVLSLNDRVEPLRGRLERELTPLFNPRAPDGSLKQGAEPGGSFISQPRPADMAPVSDQAPAEAIS